MSDYGTNAGAVAVDLFQKFETHNIKQKDAIMDEIESHTNRIKTLQAFLSGIGVHTDESVRIDWSQDPIKRSLVDEARIACPGVIPEGVYAWKGGKELELLTGRIENHISRVLSPQINLNMSKYTQKEYDLSEVLEVMINMLKECKEEIQRIQSNIKAAHG